MWTVGAAEQTGSICTAWQLEHTRACADLAHQLSYSWEQEKLARADTRDALSTGAGAASDSGWKDRDDVSWKNYSSAEPHFYAFRGAYERAPLWRCNACLRYLEAPMGRLWAKEALKKSCFLHRTLRQTEIMQHLTFMRSGRRANERRRGGITHAGPTLGLPWVDFGRKKH